MAELHIFRATERDREAAFRLVEEYNEAVSVMVRDSAESFRNDYFGPGAGIWLARVGEELAGCIALRPLQTREDAGEIKRLYVRPEFRGMGAAAALLAALETYAAEFGYHRLYLDSKDDLKAAVRFYERHGYVPCERYNQNQQATIFMQKAVTQCSGSGFDRRPAMTRDEAWNLANHWIAAWNAHDLSGIMSHYEDEVELTSPVAARLLGTADGRVAGKTNLHAYFRRGLEAYPELRFHLENVLWGVNSVVLYYTNQKGTRTAEFMELSPSKKVIRVVAHYSD